MFNLFKKSGKEDLKNSILEKMKEYVVKCVEICSNEKGEVCFIALEYFYDGAYADIGLRVGLEAERIKLEEEYGKDHDVREDGGNFSFYETLLDKKSVKPEVDSLFQYLNSIDKGEGELVWATIQDMANKLTMILRNIDWGDIGKKSEDFAVLGPYEYD